ncbi:DUF1800 domain-containing protein [Derxia lacustris]|uniref:DUF1800 domain-containing protein n=1 Tax=Derxia lacustris TaxID=764842 RepID=UPI000A172AFD|nr:DUF1800 family protein [Derxia lacustris]
MTIGRQAVPRRGQGAGMGRGWALALALLAALLAGCGGGGDATAAADSGSGAGRASVQSTASVAALADAPTDSVDAARLAQQASFGATDELIAEIAARGPAKWVAQQIAMTMTSYPALGDSTLDRWTRTDQNWCDGNFAAGTLANVFCWRDQLTATPVAWAFYRQAITGRDQLRQRMALALSHLFPVSDMEVPGTYGIRQWHQMLRQMAFANYRDLLRQVALSPVMGEFLDNANNSKTDPNENFARELLQLFSLGTCLLNHDGTLKGDACQPTYDNATVRNYAHALTGWTYPAGGRNPWCAGTCSDGSNPRYLLGNMLAVPARHDGAARTLLSGRQLAAGSTPAGALEVVLDSLMRHPNLAPRVARRLIQHFVTSNPSPAYVDAVASAFDTGLHAGIGSGSRGDLAATVAAVLLHAEARDPAAIDQPGYGRLREPMQLWTAAMRALDARSDGVWWNWAYGDEMRERPLSPPSVFGHYQPDTPLGSSGLVGTGFDIEDETTSLQRNVLLQYLNFSVGDDVVQLPAPSVAGAIGTVISHDRWLPQVADAAALVDRFDLLLTSRQLTAEQKAVIVAAVAVITPATQGAGWQNRRLRTAAYLVMMAPQFSIVR